MASATASQAVSEQYAFRAQKILGLSNGAPSYDVLDDFERPEGPARFYAYSADGSYFAYTVPGIVKVFTASDGKPFKDFPVSSAIEMGFSPRGTFLSTWERPLKLEDGSQHKNLRVWSVASGEEVISFSQRSQEKWDLQYTTDESRAIRHAGPDVQIYDPADWSKGIIDKLKVEGLTSVSLGPGANPYLAIFVGEKKGAPGSIRIHGLSTLAAAPTCQKSFFKAESVTVKWNATGTHLLLMTHTDVDKTNKSYYGETGLMLISVAGNFDCRVSLDKDGPIHDFGWSPNAKEFGVVYGYIPSKTTLFDQRVKVTAEFGSHPWNFISFNPQGRLIALAGFGNLAGKIDIFDRRSLSKITTIEAPNSSLCEWSSDGTKLLTATLSPRLRVDNGIKIWHCTGPLLHLHLIEELYQASWKRFSPAHSPPFPGSLPAPPAPSANVAAYQLTAKPTPSKPAGAYRPPGARGTATPDIFKREDEGGMARNPSNGQLTPTRPSNGRHQSGGGGPGVVRPRHVPGATPVPPVPGATPASNGTNGAHAKAARKRNRSKKEPGDDGPTDGVLDIPAETMAPEVKADPTASAEVSAADGPDPLAKKQRGLMKKLKAIEELKERVGRGDKLENTQLKKIEGEAELRRELAGLTV